MASLLSRLFRPSSSSRMGLTSDGGGGSSAGTSLAASSFPEGSQRATIAAGCFWGVEHMFRQTFGGKGGLLDARVGYIGGDKSNPSYQAVCGGRTGHAEALQVVYDPGTVSYRQLLEFFYRMHDPTTKNRQGPDAGSQYRSAIFYHDDDQERVARSVTEKVQTEWFPKAKIVTVILPAGQWWDAEAYHQLYLDRNPSGYECPSQYALPTLCAFAAPLVRSHARD
ncbi:MAG: Peptide-methionine (S)-S-oxide reductase [Phylliscum demangeonii]|nr:MAG: Peptide-methionine (S)-S-oxide reductase [Phylliscum demangeonii]